MLLLPCMLACGPGSKCSSLRACATMACLLHVTMPGCGPFLLAGIEERNAYLAGASPGYIRTLLPGAPPRPGWPLPACLLASLLACHSPAAPVLRRYPSCAGMVTACRGKPACPWGHSRVARGTLPAAHWPPHAAAAAPVAGFEAQPALPRPLPRFHARLTAFPAAVDVAVVQQGAAPPGGQPAPAAGGWQQMLAGLLGGIGGAAGAPGAAGAAGPGAGAPAAGGAGGAQGQPPVVRLTVGPQGQAVPVAIPLYHPGAAAAGQPGQQQAQQHGQQPGAAAAVQAPPMSAELSNMARLLMAQLGVGPAEQQQLLGQFGGMMAALRSSSGARLPPGLPPPQAAVCACWAGGRGAGWGKLLGGSWPMKLSLGWEARTAGSLAQCPAGNAGLHRLASKCHHAALGAPPPRRSFLVDRSGTVA